MTDKQIIEILQQQNERLLQILQKFADKEQHVNVVVNSYNGGRADATNHNRPQNGGIENTNMQN